MYWGKIFLGFYLVASLSHAQDKTGAPSDPSAKITTFSGKQSEEWMSVQNQLVIAKGKVENQQKLVENLIQQKQSLKGTELTAKIENLKEAHIELIRLINHYNTLNSDFETKFPEKGAAVGRVYKRIDPTNIEVIQNKMTLEGRLKRLNAKIRKQYPKSAEVVADTEKSEGVKKIKIKNTLPDSKTDEVQVTDQIILQK